MSTNTALLKMQGYQQYQVPSYADLINDNEQTRNMVGRLVEDALGSSNVLSATNPPVFSFSLLQITVTGGRLQIQGRQADNLTPFVQTVNTPDPTNPRYDLLCVKYVKGTTTTGAPTRSLSNASLTSLTPITAPLESDTVSWSYVPGTAAASPVLPTPTAGYEVFAVVRVNAAATSITAANVATVFPSGRIALANAGAAIASGNPGGRLFDSGIVEYRLTLTDYTASTQLDTIILPCHQARGGFVTQLSGYGYAFNVMAQSANFKVRVARGAGNQVLSGRWNFGTGISADGSAVLNTTGQNLGGAAIGSVLPIIGLQLDGVALFGAGSGVTSIASVVAVTGGNDYFIPWTWAITIPDDGAFHTVSFIQYSNTATLSGMVVYPWLPRAADGGIDTTKIDFCGPT